GATFHAGTGAQAWLSQDGNVAGEQRNAGELTGVAADGDEAAPHVAADLVACLAVHQDDAAARGEEAAAIGAADEMAGAAVNVDVAAAHLAADPVAGVAMGLAFAARHFRAKVP